MTRYELDKIRERVLTWIAWRLPRSVAYWATIRVVTSGYDGDPSSRPIVESLDAWSSS